jgi:hypothetical protein
VTPLAHIAGVPVEEVLLPFLAGPVAGLALVRAWLALRLHRHPEPKLREPGR